MHTQTDTRAHTHTLGSKKSYQLCSWEARGKSWQEKVRSDQLRMLECYSNGVKWFLAHTKREGGQAGNDKSRIPRERVTGHAGVRERSSLLDEMLYYGVVI